MCEALPIKSTRHSKPGHAHPRARGRYFFPPTITNYQVNQAFKAGPRAPPGEGAILLPAHHHERQALALVALRRAAVDASEHRGAELRVGDKGVAVDLDADGGGGLVNHGCLDESVTAGQPLL